MPVHHVKGQPAASTYVGEKECIKKDSNRDTPCSSKKPKNSPNKQFQPWVHPEP